MKIVYCHNYYRNRGGEDVSFESDLELLRNEGHEVIPFTRHNDDIDDASKWKMTLQSFWNRETYRDMLKVLKREKPDVLHCNNIFPQISISVYHAARKCHVPVVQALRNYRSFCANSFFFRDGEVCTKCHSSLASWNAIRYRCYRDNTAASAVVVGMQLMHRLFSIQNRYVDAFVTPSLFSRDIHMKGGFDAERMFVRNNFPTDDAGFVSEPENYAVFVGRFSNEKGADLAIRAWMDNEMTLPLRLVGCGPEAASYKKLAAENSNIQFMGELPMNEVLDQIGKAKFLVMPSRWFETFGRTIAEAFSRGPPLL